MNRLPPFSPVLNRLIATLSLEDASFSRVAGIIEKDPVLAANVIRTVNSAMYARLGRVSTVRHAVSLLGIEKLRNLTIGLSSFRVWNNVPVAEGWSMREFNRHSVSVAILSDLIAQRANLPCAGIAFTAGLFHDVGRLLIASGLRLEHAAINRLQQESGRSRSACEKELLGLTHAELSADALAAWRLPETIRDAVRQHHDPGDDLLSRVLWAADRCVNSGENDDGFQTALDALGLKQEQPRILEAFRAELGAVRNFF